MRQARVVRQGSAATGMEASVRWTTLPFAFHQSLAVGAVLPLVLFLVAPAASAPQDTPVTLVADHIEYDTETGAVAADGHVEISQNEVVIKADHLVGNLKTGEVEATGHVTLIQGDRTATAESLRYNFLTHSGRTEQVVTQYGAWHIESQSLETSGGQAVAVGALVTPCDPRHPIFHVTASRVVIVPGDYLTAYDASLYVYSVHVITLPSYTVSLDPRRRPTPKSGPSFGYTTLDGPYVEYNHFLLLGSMFDQARFRYGTISRFTAENTLSQRDADHLWSFHLGRLETFDVNGNYVALDASSLDLTYDTHRLNGWPFSYQVEAHVGDYSEIATGIHTTRGDGFLSLATDAFFLSPSMTAAAAGSIEFDTYGTGQQRTVTKESAAITEALSRIDSITLSNSWTGVIGSTPFMFDSIGAGSSVTLSYNNYPGIGLLQSWGVSGTYDFFAQQTTLGANIALAISPTVFFAVSGAYNTATQQVTEVDYTLNVQCDCLAVSLLVRTFPQTPSQNVYFFTLGLSPYALISAPKFGP